MVIAGNKGFCKISCTKWKFDHFSGHKYLTQQKMQHLLIENIHTLPMFARRAYIYCMDKLRWISEKCWNLYLFEITFRFFTFIQSKAHIFSCIIMETCLQQGMKLILSKLSYCSFKNIFFVFHIQMLWLCLFFFFNLFSKCLSQSIPPSLCGDNLHTLYTAVQVTSKFGLRYFRDNLL